MCCDPPVAEEKTLGSLAGSDNEYLANQSHSYPVVDKQLKSNVDPQSRRQIDSEKVNLSPTTGGNIYDGNDDTKKDTKPLIDVSDPVAVHTRETATSELAGVDKKTDLSNYESGLGTSAGEEGKSDPDSDPDPNGGKSTLSSISETGFVFVHYR